MGRSLWESMTGPSQETLRAEGKALKEKVNKTPISMMESGKKEDKPKREVLQEGTAREHKDDPSSLGGPGSVIDIVDKRSKNAGGK